MKYFNSNEDLKKQFREWAKKLHPDFGGNEEEFKAMSKEYEEIKLNGFKKQFKESTKAYGNNELNKKMEDVLRKVIYFDGVKVEIIGWWIWLEGNTYQYRKEIKDLGFRWSKNRKAWYLKDDEHSSGKKFKGSFEELKMHHGCTVISNKKQMLIGA